MGSKKPGGLGVAGREKFLEGYVAETGLPCSFVKSGLDWLSAGSKFAPIGSVVVGRGGGSAQTV